MTSWRRVETRITSDNTTVVTAAVQTPDAEGRWQTQQETTTETIADASGQTSVRRDVYTHGPQRDRVLLERTESGQTRLPDDTLHSTSRTWTTDVNGHLGVLSQSIEERGANKDASQSSTRLFVPDVNGRLTESVRTVQMDRQVSPGAARRDSSVTRRDLNGSWQPIETRQTVVRDDDAEHTEEETVSRRDVNDVAGIAERNVTRRSRGDGREDVVIERYVPRDPGAMHRSLSRMELSERVRISTTTASDGTRETVEDVEARNPVAAGDPMRLRRRIVTTVRSSGGDQSSVERQVFDLDANGRLVLTATEHREGSAP